MPKLIYIAEDEKVNGELLRNKLRMEGYDAIWAANGKEIIELVNSKVPDMVLLDLLMPDFNGFDVLETFSKENKLKDLKVLILSNLMLPEDKEKAKKYGVLDYLIKSDSSLQDIVKKVEYYLR